MIEVNYGPFYPVSTTGYAPDEVPYNYPAPTLTDEDMEIAEENAKWYRRYCLGIKE